MGQKVLGKERKKGFYCNGEEKGEKPEGEEAFVKKEKGLAKKRKRRRRKSGKGRKESRLWRQGLRL